MLETSPVRRKAAVGQIVDALAFDSELVLETANRIVAGVQRACDRLEAGELKWRLFSGIDDDFRTQVLTVGFGML